MLIDTIKELCALSGVSSFEDEVRAYLKEKAAPYADALRVDAMGSLIVFKKGRRSTGNKLLLAAHMDEVGLIVKNVTDDGYLKFFRVGGIDRRVLIGKSVFVGQERNSRRHRPQGLPPGQRGGGEDGPMWRTYIDIGAREGRRKAAGLPG